MEEDFPQNSDDDGVLSRDEADDLENLMDDRFDEEHLAMAPRDSRLSEVHEEETIRTQSTQPIIQKQNKEDQV